MVAIVAAMEEELAAVVALLEAPEVSEVGGRTFYRDLVGGHVAVVSRIGKVAAAATTAILIERFAPDAVVMIGLAGGVAPHLAVGDVVIADALIQHDLDARPLFPRHEAPGLGIAAFPADRALADRLAAGASAFVEPSRVHRGLIASGDRFFASAQAVAELRELLPATLAVEMEGAAIAQVCYEHGVPFAVARVISDSADHDAAVDFATFLRTSCGPYTRALVAGVLHAT